MDELLTMAEVSDLLKVSRNTVYRWGAEGRLQTVKTASGTVRVKRRDLEAFIAGGTAHKQNNQ